MGLCIATTRLQASETVALSHCTIIAMSTHKPNKLKTEQMFIMKVYQLWKGAKVIDMYF